MHTTRTPGSDPGMPVGYVMHTCWIQCVWMTAAWRMWALAAAFYLVAIFHRMSLGVASLDASERFGVSTARSRCCRPCSWACISRCRSRGGAGGPARAAAVAHARAAGDGRRVSCCSRSAPRSGPAIVGPRAGRCGRRLHVPQRPARRGVLAAAPPLCARGRADRGDGRVRPAPEHRAAQRRAVGRGLDADVRRQRRAHRGAGDPRRQPAAGPAGGVAATPRTPRSGRRSATPGARPQTATASGCTSR